MGTKGANILVVLALVAGSAVAAPRSPITNNAEWQNGRPVALPELTRPKMESVFLYRPETSHNVIVSRQKEAVEVRRVGLNQLDAVSGAPIPVPSP